MCESTTEVSRFVNPPPDFLVCAICQEVVPSNPDYSVHLPCGHIFCISDISRVRGSCPTCRTIFSFNKKLSHPSLFVQRGILLELNVKCINEGCEKIIPYGDLNNHIKNCDHVFMCTCGFPLSSRYKEHHSCEDRTLAELAISSGSTNDLWKRSILRNYSYRPDIIELLLDNGISVNTCIFSEGEEAGSTILHISATTSNATTDLLIKRGANVNALNRENSTPIIKAASVNNFKCAKTLMEAGADLNVVNNSGNNILHHFAWFSNYEACKFFSDRGVCFGKINIKGKPPAELTLSTRIRTLSLLHTCIRCRPNN